MANEDDRLTAQLSHISIGSLEDTLSKQLNNTYLTNTPATSFHTPTNHHHTANEPTTPWPSAVLNRPAKDTPSWQTTSQPPTTNEDQDGWGDAPAYTSLLPYTQFGFTSTIVPSYQSSIPSSSILKKDTITLNPDQPFSRYIHQPVSFASFPPPPPPSSNNASFFDQ